ncbi:uncharacterized protein PHACADRAFT_84769 [Phanerochaete carnosa HHB-10118-sp]|uniref:Cyclin-like domain-containing protein n=1 Tax=Phanerochaete carnosa (strain HHB-10118-sp) TaxID=650164 RepID=K5VDA5_PHACS|nr:uncharacterized protein PHACADRAFT_84769 [Phanerochaete carnosa HHB-10118-sp]EKM60956.1 hypothetical protein PHACADRAFT_84769 [Phanerochaete carnosa HHB-10118-sp]
MNGESLPQTSRIPLYEGSTQFRHWRFSPEQLAETRSLLNAAAVAVIRDAFESDQPGSSSQVSFLSAEEENLLVKLYLGKIPQLCGIFRFPEEVEATAMSYLKRFYLKNTVMDWHPKNVMLTVVFLATKTTNYPIPLDAYASRIPKTTPGDVLDLEFLVAQSLGFDFTIWHAHRALWGLWLDIQTLSDIPLDDLSKAYDGALTSIRASRFTDAEFIYTPSQIALACLSIASPALASAWLRSKSGQGSDDAISAMLEPLKAMVLSQGSLPDVEAVREVDRRLRLCKNPEKIPGTNAYNKKVAEKQRKAEEKRLRKAELQRKAMEDGDPFGSTLTAQADLDDDDDDE